MLLLAEDVDGEEDTNTGWEVLRNPGGELAVGSQIGVKVCYFSIVCYVINLLL